MFRGRIANCTRSSELYLALGQHDDAIREYRRALSVAPKYPDLRVRLVTALREAGGRTRHGTSDAFLAETRKRAALIQKGSCTTSREQAPALRAWKRRSTRIRSTRSCRCT